MALMIGALIIQGIVPGPNVAAEQPELFWGIIASMWIGNLMLVRAESAAGRALGALLRVPYYVLFPAIMAFCRHRRLQRQFQRFDLYSVAVFGVLGYVLFKLGCEPAPLLLGFVLGPMLEEHLRRAMIISRGDPAIFIERPISLGLLIFAALALIIVFLPSIARKREQVFVEDD